MKNLCVPQPLVIYGHNASAEAYLGSCAHWPLTRLSDSVVRPGIEARNRPAIY
jgi:hypothetical protein